MRGLEYVRRHGLAAVAGLAFLFVAFSQAVGGRTSLQALWRGYGTLVVSDDVPLRDVVDGLSRGMDRERIVSALTSVVEVNVFDGRELIAVADLERRLDTLDPRYDEYMRKLPAMFHVSSGERSAHVLYIRTALTPAFLTVKVRRLLRGLDASWSIPELAPLRNLLYLAAAVLFFLVVASGGRDSATGFLAAAALPWLLNCVFGGVTDLLTFYLVFPFCCAFLASARSLWRSGARLTLAELKGSSLLSGLGSLGVAAGVAAVFVLLLGGPRDLTRLAAALAADLLLLGGALAWSRRARSDVAHRVFLPVAIGARLYRVAGIPRPSPRFDFRRLLASPRSLAVTRTAQAGALLALVCVSPLVPYLVGRTGTEAIPVPIRSGSERLTWDSLHRLWTLTAADELPSVADYVAHAAYQQGLPYGVSYHLPSRDEPVMLAVFRIEGDKPAAVEEQRTVLRYTDRWLRETLAGAGPTSVGRLLVAQGRAARVGLSVSGDDSARRPEFWKIAAYSAMVVFFLAFGSHYLRPSLLSGRSRAALIRRRQQEA